tara:strand:+ start:203 stop:775 length:573 start_codon:yes stop_codon:yes gene_type:complete
MKKIAIFGSGRGSNAQNFINYFKSHKSISVKLIFTNNPNAGILDVAKQNKMDFKILTKADFQSGKELLKDLKFHKISFIILAGFLLKIPELIITNFTNAIINIHPALLPKFGGKGMYGLNVHKAVLESNDSFSGITIHYVNSEYDKGKIIFQAKCNILKDDNPTLLSKRVQKLEYKFYPIITEKIIIHGN